MMQLEKELAPGFSAELAVYKQQLRKVRSELGLKPKVLAEAGGTSADYYYTLEAIPWVDVKSLTYKNLPNKKGHKGFIKALRQADVNQHFVNEIAELDSLYQNYVIPELARRRANTDNSNRSEIYKAALYLNFAELENKLQPGFSKEMLHYKELLKEIRTSLDFDIKLFEKIGINKTTYYFYEKIPYLEHPRNYNMFPNSKTHEAITKIFHAASDRDEHTEKLDELNNLYRKHVIPAVAVRKKLGQEATAASVIDAAHERANQIVSQTEVKTALSKFILQRMQISKFSIFDLCLQIHANIVLDKMFERLDEPVKYDERLSRDLAARWLKGIMDFPVLAFSAHEKETMRQLFNINCWNSALDGKALADRDIIEVYKITLEVLILQAGLSLEEAGEMFGGISRQAIEQFLIVDKNSRFSLILPNAERHDEFCDSLKKSIEKGLLAVDLDDLNEFSKLHKPASVESRRYNSLRGPKPNFDGMLPLSRAINEILRERNIAQQDVPASMGINLDKFRTMLASKVPGRADAIAEILCRRNRAADIDDTTPTYELGSEDGVTVILVKQNFAPSGVEVAGKSYVPGLSGLSFVDRMALEYARIEEQGAQIKKL